MSASPKLPVYNSRGRRVRTTRDYVIYAAAAAVAVGGVLIVLSLF